MPKTDLDPLGDAFKWRLRAELNRITPRHTSPRYLSPPRRRIVAWRFAPAGLAVGLVGILGLMAYAASGSPNPVVWTEQIVTKIEPSAAPTPPPSAQPSEHPAAPEASNHSAGPTSRPGPSERPEPSEKPEPTQPPEPRDGGDSGSHGGR